MEVEFEQFEADVMKHIIMERPDFSEELMRQYEASKVINRDTSIFGFYTSFEISNKGLRLKDNPNLELGDTQAKLEGLELGAGFVLFIRDGLIKALECYTYDEPWPTKITKYVLS
ncbi:MAG: hypothetical protein LBV08_01740 [Clostridiales bacterium]|nr:hypothetical protein [Clostridiales bacterium]